MEVTALTDVTGFGPWAIYLKSVKEAMYLLLLIIAKCLFSKRFMTIDKKCVPGGTLRNWDSYGHKLTLKMKSKDISCVIHKLVADY
jgi:selenide,water dikinase